MTDDALVRPRGGETITAREQREILILSESPDVTITWSRYGAGERGPNPHVHREHTDAFYVLAGELTFLVGPQLARATVAAGGVVVVPPNVVHAFANEGPVDASYLNFHAPDTGFARYLRALRDGTTPEFDQVDPPPDGGRPRSEVVIAGPGEGERLASADGAVLLKASRPEICIAEWTNGVPPALDGWQYGVEPGSARAVSVHAPGAGVAERLRSLTAR